MSLSSRTLRRSALCLLSMLSGLCAAQQSPQFYDPPQVQLTGGRVASFVTGTLQNPPGGATDILYIGAPAGSGANTSVTVGELLSAQGFTNQPQNQIVFPGVSNIVAAVADFNGDAYNDYAFALTPIASSAPNLCIYFGTGLGTAQGGSYNGGGTYPPTGTSGCMTLRTTGSAAPSFTSIAAFPFKTTGGRPQLAVEDSANGSLYVLSNSGVGGSGGALSGVALTQAIPLNPADGPGPIYTGDFNNDGNTDLIVNGQTSDTATIYYGNGDGTFQPPLRLPFTVHSMLLYNFNSNGPADLIAEGANGVLSIYPGTGVAATPFNTTRIGGTSTIPDAFAGNGGHLAAINPNTLAILTTTPIGLSLLEDQGSLSYSSQAIYNIGPGRSSYALANFFGTASLDFAVDSPEGVAILPGNSSGGFNASYAFPTLAPALSSVVGQFRNSTNNPKGIADAVVSTNAVQGQLLVGNGNGTFDLINGNPTNPYGSPSNLPATLWSNLAAGDFNGDHNLDLAYSLTGLPQPSPGPNPGLYIQYGNGDGTFQPPVAVTPSSAGASAGNDFYGTAATGDFNGDSLVDLANFSYVPSSGTAYENTLLGQTDANSSTPFTLGFTAGSNNLSFPQVAAGFFKENRTIQQDLVFQQGANFIPYKNAQDKTGIHFTAEPAIAGAAPPLYPATVLLADVDGDGNGDLVVAYDNTAANPVGAGPVAPSQLSIWYGNGDGTFAATPQVLTLSRNYYLAAVADMNNDGRPDLVLSDGSLVSILYNQGSRSFGTLLSSGEYSSEQHFLAGQGINSLSVKDVNGDGNLDLVVANGGASISNPIALGGETQSSLALTPNPDVNTGGITVLVNSILTRPVTGTLSATPEPGAVTAAFTLTATLTPTPGVAVPTGTVQFTIGGALVGTPVALLPGATTSTATFTIPAGNTYPSGTYALTAMYSGDANNSPATLTGSHTIQDSATTTQILMCIGPTTACPAPPAAPNPYPPYSAALPMYYGQIWNGYIEVTANDGSTLTGTLELLDAYTGTAAPPPTPLCTLVLGVTPECPNSVGTTQGTSVGVNVLTGVYVPGPGDTHTTSTSLPTAITVLPDITSAATLAGSPNSSPLGLPVTFTATLTGNYAAPTGLVTFYELAPNTALQTPIGTGTLTPGTGLTSTAAFTTTTLPLGTDTITADYPATTNFGAATFPIVTEIITPSIAGSFTLTVAPTPITAPVGIAAVLSVTVTPTNGFSQAVTLSCANLPPETTCSFASPTLAAGSTSTALLVQTTPPHSCNSTQPYFNGSVGRGPLAPFALPALAGLVLLAVPGRRRWLRALAAIAVAASIAQITGCGNCTDLGTRPATYTFQVTATASATSAAQSQSVTINVTI